MARVLLDENTSLQLVSPLEQAGHTVWHVATSNASIHDDQVLILAHKYQAILVTHDRDFPRMVFAEQYDHLYPIVLLREKAQKKRDILPKLVQVLAQPLVGKTLIVIGPYHSRLKHR